MVEFKGGIICSTSVILKAGSASMDGAIVEINVEIPRLQQLLLKSIENMKPQQREGVSVVWRSPRRSDGKACSSDSRILGYNFNQ